MRVGTVLLGICLLLGGCAAQHQPKTVLAPVTVPSDAQLIWYGRLDQSGNIPLPSAPGQVYFVDDASGRVMSVQTSGKPVTRPAADPTILPMHKAYRVYFVKDAGMTPATRPISKSRREKTMRIIPLTGKAATEAVDGKDRHGIEYVDLMPDGTLVLFDSAVSHEQFRGGLARIVAHGGRRLIVRVTDRSPPDLYAFVRDAAESAGIRDMEVVRLDASTLMPLPWKTP